MYYHITKLVNLLKLPEDIIIYILHFSGFLKLRNGKYMNQINTNFSIYKKLEKVPRFINWKVRLPVKTAWIRKSFCDKMIVLGNVNYSDQTIPTIGRKYQVSWYEFDYEGEMHKISTEIKILVFQNRNVAV